MTKVDACHLYRHPCRPRRARDLRTTRHQISLRPRRHVPRHRSASVRMSSRASAARHEAIRIRGRGFGSAGQGDRHRADPRVGGAPGWTRVWIATDVDSHLQATGRDARGRRQYRYHLAFTASRDDNKLAHLSRSVTASVVAYDASISAAITADLTCLKLYGWCRSRR